jgi:hypothetical protein
MYESWLPTVTTTEGFVVETVNAPVVQVKEDSSAAIDSAFTEQTTPEIVTEMAATELPKRAPVNVTTVPPA